MTFGRSPAGSMQAGIASMSLAIGEQITIQVPAHLPGPVGTSRLHGLWHRRAREGDLVSQAVSVST